MGCFHINHSAMPGILCALIFEQQITLSAVNFNNLKGQIIMIKKTSKQVILRGLASFYRYRTLHTLGRSHLFRISGKSGSYFIEKITLGNCSNVTSIKKSLMRRGGRGSMTRFSRSV